MKKFIFSLIVLVGASSAYADANLAMEDNIYKKYADESKSHYQTLGDLFKSGSAPDLNKLVGVAWAGRCFLKKQPNTATSAGYIFRVDRKVGPIAEAYEAASYWNLSKAPDFFDTMTLDEVYNYSSSYPKKTSFKEINSYEDGILIHLNEKPVSKLKFSYEDGISIHLIKKQVSKLRISGEYLIEEISVRKNSDTGPIKKNTYKTTIRCYYFIPEYNKK